MSAPDQSEARPMPADWRALYRLPPGLWELAPEALDWTGAEAWARRLDRFDVITQLSSGDTACRVRGSAYYDG